MKGDGVWLSTPDERNMEQMRILFIGCVESSQRLLLKLIEKEKNVVGVITRERSNFNADFVDLMPLCKEHEIPCHYVNNVNDEDSIEFIRSLSPDIGYCFGWSQLLKEELLQMFPRGVVGFHPAALPNNRGRHPIIWALALGLQETASSFFMMNVGADEGEIVSQRKIEISYYDDAKTLYDKILNEAEEQEIEFTEAYETGTIQFIPQSPQEGNSWRKRGKEDGRIDWRMSGRSIYNLVRSLTRPYVGAHFVYQGQDHKVWKVMELQLDGQENIEPGKVLDVHEDGTIDVKVADGAVRLMDFEQLQIQKGEYII